MPLTQKAAKGLMQTSITPNDFSAQQVKWFGREKIAPSCLHYV